MRSWMRFLFLYLMEVVELSMFISVGILTLWFGVQQFIPNIEDVETIIRRPYIRVLNNQDELIASYGDFYSKPVEIEELPKYLIDGLLDIEDRRFFHHIGFDISSIIRAFFLNLTAGRITQGGSSITQQLAKNFFISKGIFDTYDQSIQRKVYEVILSVMFEKKYTKKQILSFYLNRVYFGASAFGIAAAAERFFNKTPSELNLYEAARLVGGIQAPSRFLANKEQGDKRALQVIDTMLKHNHITEEDKELALLLATKPDVTTAQPISRYFADWIVQCIPEEIYAKSDDITVKTTLDPQWQEIAEKHAHEVMNTWGKDWQAETLAMMICDPDGAIKVMIGDLDYSKSKFNNVTSALRQGGSVYKILVYLTALENGFKADTMVPDDLIKIGKWEPKNFKYKAQGELSVQEAFARSVNTVSLRLGMAVTADKIREMSQRLLITSPIPNNLSITLGTSELTMLEILTPVLTIANQGNLISPYGLKSIEDTKTKEVLYQRQPNDKNIVLAGDTVNNMLSLMEANVQMGSGRRANFGHPAGGKTGSTQNERDKWFVGFTSHAVGGVRFSTNKLGMNYILGKPLATELWRRFMEELHKTSKFPIIPLKRADEENVMDKTDYKGMMSDIINDKFSPEEDMVVEEVKDNIENKDIEDRKEENEDKPINIIEMETTPEVNEKQTEQPLEKEEQGISQIDLQPQSDEIITEEKQENLLQQKEEKKLESVQELKQERWSQEVEKTEKVFPNMSEILESSSKTAIHTEEKQVEKAFEVQAEQVVEKTEQENSFADIKDTMVG